jgi:hypothetical protein
MSTNFNIDDIVENAVAVQAAVQAAMPQTEVNQFIEQFPQTEQVVQPKAASTFGTMHGFIKVEGKPPRSPMVEELIKTQPDHHKPLTLQTIHEFCAELTQKSTMFKKEATANTGAVKRTQKADDEHARGMELIAKREENEELRRQFKLAERISSSKYK